MTVPRRGHGGWVNSGRRPARVGMVILAAALLMVAGCASKKNGSAGENANGPGAGLGENGVNGSGGNSLNQYKKGTRGQNQGPLGDIHFDYNDSTIRQQDGGILQNNAAWLNQNPNARVQIEGHCDDRGSEEYNIALGAQRAQAAKDYMQTLGISSDRMSTISYGKELPLCNDETDDCWAQNRRDHFVVQQ